MKSKTKAFSIGILTEDPTDTATLKVLIHRILGRKVSVKSIPVWGCAQLRRKAANHIKQLHVKGCRAFIILHDLDRRKDTNELNDENELREELCKRSPYSSDSKRHICIPIEELEAWFFYDVEVLRVVSGDSRVRARKNPESIKGPKEVLRNKSYRGKSRPLYSTNDNSKLAEKLDLDTLSESCAAFIRLKEFLLSLELTG